MDELSQDNTLYRTPQENAKLPEIQAQPAGETPTTPSEDTATPSELTKLDRPPYLIDLMEAGEAYKTFDVEPLSKEIDQFLNAEVERRGLKDTKENYKKVLDEIYKNITPTDSIYTNLEQLVEWVRIQQKLIDALEEKKKFEAMDPSEMSSRQLERYLNGNR